MSAAFLSWVTARLRSRLAMTTHVTQNKSEPTNGNLFGKNRNDCSGLRGVSVEPELRGVQRHGGHITLDLIPRV
jgi:hypothetical protein